MGRTLESRKNRQCRTLAHRSLLDTHAHVVPSGLPGHGSGVRMAIAILLRQPLRDDVVEQEAFRALRRIGRQIPRALTLADRIPGPDRVGIDALHGTHQDADMAMKASHTDIIVIRQTELLRRLAINVQEVLREYLAPPRVLAIQRMV